MLGIAHRGAGKLYVKLYETLRETPKIAQKLYEKGKTLRRTLRNFTPSGIHFHSAFLCRTFASANGKVNQRSTPEGAEVKTENGKLIA